MTMRMRAAVTTWVVATVIGLVACSDDATDKPSSTQQATDNCWPQDPSCKMPDGAGFECLALSDNKGKAQWDFRISQLDVIKPDALAGPLVQDTVVTRNITLDMPKCIQEGTGRFNWLMQFDYDAKVVRTGGAKISKDPMNDGFCFINEPIEGFDVGPMEVPITTSTVDGKDTFDTSEPIKKLNVPIYLDDEMSSVVLLPLHQVMLTGGKISGDHNCIGSWMGDELEPGNWCLPDPDLLQEVQWVGGATLQGFVTVEESDDVWVKDLLQTLCAVLATGDSSLTEEFVDGDKEGKRCKRDAEGNILARSKADWCATANTACQAPDADAFLLKADFAASAVKVNGSCP